MTTSEPEAENDCLSHNPVLHQCSSKRLLIEQAEELNSEIIPNPMGVSPGLFDSNEIIDQRKSGSEARLSIRMSTENDAEDDQSETISDGEYRQVQDEPRFAMPSDHVVSVEFENHVKHRTRSSLLGW